MGERGTRNGACLIGGMSKRGNVYKGESLKGGISKRGDL